MISGIPYIVTPIKLQTINMLNNYTGDIGEW
jgi:hypothetical protein